MSKTKIKTETGVSVGKAPVMDSINVSAEEVKSFRDAIGNTKHLDAICKKFGVDSNHLNKVVREKIGAGLNLISNKKEFKVYPPIFLIMIGFGIADKNRDHTHNLLLVKFLKESGFTELAQKFESFWEAPQKSSIRWVPASAIYPAMNELNCTNVLKAKGRAPRLFILPIKKRPKMKLINKDIADVNWNEIFMSFRDEIKS